MARRVTGKVRLLTPSGGIEVEALFDTGATHSFVDLVVAEKLGYTRYEEPREVLLAVKDKRVKVVGDLTAWVWVEGCRLPLRHVFGVIEGLRHDVIIGMDVMEPYELEPDVKEGRIKFKRYPPVLELV